MAFGASAQAIANVRSYEEAEAFLAAKGVNSRKICGNNTYVERREYGDIAIRLHQTDIITFQAGLAPLIVLDTGGWHSLITKQRLEQFLPAPLTVYSFKGQWRIGLKDGQRWANVKADNTNSIVFTDGLKLIHNTVGWEPLNALSPEEEAKTDAAKRSLDKAVKAYCKKLERLLPEWRKELRETSTLKTTGDPWCCTMQMDRTTDHLHTHLTEGYVFPTIVVRAFEDSGQYASPDRSGNGMTPVDWAVRAIAYGWDHRIVPEVAKYLRKRLDPVRALTTARTGEVAALPNAALERYTEHAKEVLQEPDSYAYFGKDESLYKTSAPTFGRNRDSEYIENANFEIVWETLVEEFPDLVTTTEGVDSKAVTVEKPGGIYVHGASHWACGWVEQIVVPVVKDTSRPVGPSNLHPAFIRVCEFAEQTKMYPVLPGAEERAAEAEHAAIVKDIASWQDYLADKGDPWVKAFSAEHLVQFVYNPETGEDEYDWYSAGVLKLHEAACYEDSLAQVDGQGVLL